MTTNEPTDQTPDAVEPADTAAEAPTVAQPVVPSEQPVVDIDPRRPAWLTRTVAVAGGVAAATFVIGGAAGYAIGHATGDDRDGSFPARFARDGGPQRFEGDGPGFGGPAQQGQQGQQGQQLPQGPGQQGSGTTS